MTVEYDRTALLALPRVKEGSAEQAGLLSWSRPYLIESIRDHGVDVVVTRGADAFSETQAEAHDVVTPQYTGDMTDVTIHRMGSVGLGELGVIRNILRPIFADTATPILNPNSVRSLARDKHAIAEKVLRPAGVYERSSMQLSGASLPSEIDDALGMIPGDMIVAKPIGGQRSRGVFVGDKQEVGRILEGIEEPYLVEEKLDFSEPFPHIRAMNDTEQIRLKRANTQGVNKELRMYYFGDGEWDGVMRVARPGETNFLSDEWLYIDLDTIPQSVIEGAEQVISNLHRIIGTDEFNIAIDWVYATSASQTDPAWQVMEVNAAEPQLVQLKENFDVGRRHHQKMAIQISRIALS